MGDEKDLEVYAIGNKRATAFIKYSGVLDMLELLRFIKNWFGKRYYDVAEKEHSELVKSAGKEITIEFEADRKITEYVRFKINVRIYILRLIDVLIDTPEGKEKKQQGEVEIGVKSWMVKNYKGTFKKKEKSKIQEFFRQVYERFIGKTHLDNLKKKLETETLMLIDEIKTSLNIFKRSS